MRFLGRVFVLGAVTLKRNARSLRYSIYSYWPSLVSLAIFVFLKINFKYLDRTCLPKKDFCHFGNKSSIFSITSQGKMLPSKLVNRNMLCDAWCSRLAARISVLRWKKTTLSPDLAESVVIIAGRDAWKLY